MRIFYFSLLIIISLLITCNQSEGQSLYSPNLQPGVVISFDDNYVTEWDEAHHILKEYGWKATFFVSRFNQLTPEEIEKLKALQNYGHEIGGHGLNHLDAVKYISECGKEEYLYQEIYPMINIMDENSIHITSFAYPFGSRNGLTDTMLLEEFKIIRGTTNSSLKPDIYNCYYDNSRIVFGLGIDKSYSHYCFECILSVLEYAANYNKIVIFYAHKPVSSIQNQYETEYQTLIKICEFVESNKLKFYTVSELDDL